MSNHLFLADADARPPVVPTDRWQTAFSQGRWLDRGAIWPACKAGDMVWLPTALPDWEALLRRLVAERPASPVVVVSNIPESVEGLRAIDRGARGYCHAYAVPGLFTDVAQVVSQGGLWVGPELLGRLVAAARDLLGRAASRDEAPAEVDLSMLSLREAEVARAVVAGKSNREVAEALFISERTVKAHLGAVFEKLGVRDRVQLVLHLSGRLPQTVKAG